MLSRENTAVSKRSNTTPAGRDPGWRREGAARLAGVLALPTEFSHTGIYGDCPRQG